MKSIKELETELQDLVARSLDFPGIINYTKIATGVEKLLREAKTNELELCKMAILRSWGMNYCEQRIAELRRE
ncbi:MAG: hypothetical protein JRJ39_00160 [Deltaproteobacteria bacterium]|nr:hypothetical protein [Deltaproteobacteria bacterium]